MFLTDYEIGILVKKKLHFVDSCFELPNFHSFTDMIKALNSIPATDNFYFIFFLVFHCNRVNKEMTLCYHQQIY